MAVVLYKKGKGSIVNGVECEKTIVDCRDLHASLLDGWYLSTDDFPEDEKEIVIEQEKEENGMQGKREGQGETEALLKRPYKRRI